jgi:hypothetical protein
MQYFQEIEIDGVYHDIEYNVSCDYTPGEKKTYDNPGEDAYVDIWGIQVVKIDGFEASGFTTEVIDIYKSMLNHEACEEEYMNYIEALSEPDEDGYMDRYYDPDEDI